MPSAQFIYLPHTRLRHSRAKAAPVTPAQAQERLRRQKIRDANIEEAIAAWKSNTLAIANDLAKQFKKKPRYFLDLFFQGGVRLLRKQTKANAHNAFLYFKAEELREQGIKPSFAALHTDEIKEEYKNIAPNVLKEMVNKHLELKSDEGKNRVTVSAKSHIHDAYAVLDRIRRMIQSLNVRVGIEGFFCIVRNNPHYHMEPQWFFTSEALMEYMPIAAPMSRPWDLAYVGAKVEAFAIAGCDRVNMYRTSKQKVDKYKRLIREKITAMLVEITGDSTAHMKYANHEEHVVQKYGVGLVGWTYEKLVNPSELSTSLPALRRLLEAIESGQCKFIKLSPEELHTWRQEQEQKVDDGVVAVKQRKTRSDKGLKRARPSAKNKQVTSAEEIGNGIDDDEDDSALGEPQRKRAAIA